MMTSLQKQLPMPIPSLLFVVIFLLSTASTLAEVVKSLSVCDHFLLEGTPPQVPGILEGEKILNQNRYKPICQTYRNERRFVTLYDIKNKIPVFSAYKYRGEEERGRPKKHWQIEPQLENEHDDKNMMSSHKQKSYNHQAVSADYRSNGTFDRGHILPSSYGFSRNDKRSTFTLTNIVPQAGTFNKGSWNRMERCVQCIMDKFCVNSNNVTEGFVVTGARPSSNNTLNNKINVPSTLWSAFCCYSSNVGAWIASAHWSDNVPDESGKKYLQTKTLAELHDELRTADSEFKVFPGTRCPLDTTVAEFYPVIKNCHCLPSNSTTSATPTSTSARSTSVSTASTSMSATPTSTSAMPTSISTTSTSMATSAHPISTLATPTSTSTTPTSGPPMATSTPPTFTLTTPTSTHATPTLSSTTPIQTFITPMSFLSTSTATSNPSTAPPSKLVTPTSTSGLPKATSAMPTSTISATPTSTSTPPTSTPAPSTSMPDL